MALTLMVFSIFCLRGILHGTHAWLVSFTGDYAWVTRAFKPRCLMHHSPRTVYHRLINRLIDWLLDWFIDVVVSCRFMWLSACSVLYVTHLGITVYAL